MCQRPVVVTSENMESITPRDGKAMPVRIESGEVSIRGGVDINNSVEVTSTQLSNAIRALASGSSDYRFLLEFPDGAIHEIGNRLVDDEAAGAFVGFGDND